MLRVCHPDPNGDMRFLIVAELPCQRAFADAGRTVNKDDLVRLAQRTELFLQLLDFTCPVYELCGADHLDNFQLSNMRRQSLSYARSDAATVFPTLPHREGHFERETYLQIILANSGVAKIA